MLTKDYLPRPDSDFSVWFQSFSSKLPSHAVELNIAPAEITQFSNDAADVAKKLTDLQNAKTALQSLTQSKNDLFAVIEKRIRDKVVVIKHQSGYTEAIGEDLGIVPPKAIGGSLAADGAKPDFTATVLANMVRLDWVKGQFDGVLIQCKRGTETAFTFLDKDTQSPYEDARPNINPDQHEARIYRMRYLMKDQEIGIWSDEIKVYCMF
jgi:hypothetical protein